MLRPYDEESARNLIDFIKSFRIKNSGNKNSVKIYLSDEFYLLAGIPFPGYSHYGRFLQLQNGVGKSADFVKDFKHAFCSKQVTARLLY
jgi:NifB/MoaA-like Fe-S oxidoreductase